MRREDGDTPIASQIAVHGDSSLPFKVELWDEAGATVQRVIARAAGALLARAAFDAAVSEHLGRRITLRHGKRVIADSR